MEVTVEMMEAQLKRWSEKIHHLAEKTHMAGARARFEDVMYIDELKALYALTKARFDEFKAAGVSERPRLRAALTGAWNDLDAAFKTPKRSK